MNTKDLQRTVSEIFGWTDLSPNPYPQYCSLCGFNDSLGKTKACNGGSKWGVPEYTKSRDAIIEEISRLDGEVLDWVETFLYTTAKHNSYNCLGESETRIWMATASQICEALVEAWEVEGICRQIKVPCRVFPL